MSLQKLQRLHAEGMAGLVTLIAIRYGVAGVRRHCRNARLSSHDAGLHRCTRHSKLMSVAPWLRKDLSENLYPITSNFTMSMAVMAKVLSLPERKVE